MNLRVKIFTGDVSKSIEEQINTWLVESESIRVLSILQSECDKWTTITILYRILDKK